MTETAGIADVPCAKFSINVLLLDFLLTSNSHFEPQSQTNQYQYYYEQPNPQQNPQQNQQQYQVQNIQQYQQPYQEQYSPNNPYSYHQQPYYAGSSNCFSSR